MPIRAEYRHFYCGKAWSETRERILKRDGYRCRQCRKPRNKTVFTYTWKSRDPIFGGPWRYHMIWIVEGAKVWRNQYGKPVCPYRMRGLPRRVYVRLGVAHDDHSPANMADHNLNSWCGWCHLHHDRPHHKETRCDRKDAGRPILSEGATEGETWLQSS